MFGKKKEKKTENKEVVKSTKSILNKLEIVVKRNEGAASKINIQTEGNPLEEDTMKLAIKKILKSKKWKDMEYEGSFSYEGILGKKEFKKKIKVFDDYKIVLEDIVKEKIENEDDEYAGLGISDVEDIDVGEEETGTNELEHVNEEQVHLLDENDVKEIKRLQEESEEENGMIDLMSDPKMDATKNDKLQISEDKLYRSVETCTNLQPRSESEIKEIMGKVAERLGNLTGLELSEVTTVEERIKTITKEDYIAKRKELYDSGKPLVRLLNAIVADLYSKYGIDTFEELEKQNINRAITLLLLFDASKYVMTNLKVMRAVFPNLDEEILSHINPEIFGVSGTWDDPYKI